MSREPSALSALPLQTMVAGIRTYAVFTLDPDGVIDSWNEGVGALLGYAEHEFVGQDGSMIFTLADRARNEPERELATARRLGEAIDDRWHVRKDGSPIWVNGIMHCVRDEAGAVVGYLKLLRDQTEKRLLDESLRESEERFSKAFRSNPTPVALFELPALTLTELNASFTRTFMVERPQVLGRTLTDLGLAVDAATAEMIRRELGNGRPVSLEAGFRRGNGDEGLATLAFEPVELGGEPHAVLLMHDMTEWRLAHQQLEEQNRFLAALLNSVPGVFYMLDGRRLVEWNGEFERVTGLSSAELASATAVDVVVEGRSIFQHVEQVLESGHAAIEGHLLTKDGRELPYLLTGRRVERNGKELVLGVGVDISELVAERASLKRRTMELAAIAEMASTALASEDLDEVLVQAARLVGTTVKADLVQVVELGGAGSTIRAAYVSPAAADGEVGGGTAALRERTDRATEGPEADAWPPEALAPSGMRSGVRARIYGRGRPFGFVEALAQREEAFNGSDLRFLSSVSYLLAGALEQLRLQTELQHRADHDDLTGLLTRVAFERRLEAALARAERSRSQVAVLFLDLDRFKQVNDSLGHQAGDEVLRTVARRLSDTVRSWDVVARHGGDEFVLFMPDVGSGAEIAHVTQRLLDAFDVPIDVGGRQVRVSTTVGIASYPEDGADVESLLRAADTALYEGKARGRNTFHFYTAEQNARVMQRLELESALRNALDRDEFALVYQPQVDLAAGAVSVVEALLRWHHPERGEVRPSEFLPVLESLGLAVALGEWTLRRAFKDHASWRGKPGAPSRVAVNVSPLYFLQPAFPDSLLAIAEEVGLAPSEVELELREPAIVKDPELALSHLQALRRAGVRVAIDDFGTTASPLALARLPGLPIDRLKVDETFNHHLSDPQGRQLVESLVDIAIGLGLEPVAEGIETSEQDAAVRQLGFGAAQGRNYYQVLEVGELLEQLGATAPL